MDLLFNTGDSISFQEMLDLDIKNEIDAANDFPNYNFTFADAPPLDLDESPSEINMWFTGSNSNSNFNDFIGSEAAGLMVNPNSVMPLALVTVPPKSNSPTVVKSPSPTQKLTVVKLSELETEKKSSKLKIASPMTKLVKDVKNNSLVNIKSAIQKQFISNNSFDSVNNVRMVQNSRKQQFNSRHDIDIKVYPKPAYSYSCLIAMALKNSRTGSLPVSEIYNFMCEHFPYFKTAPNGWKNSVRHNLSLNKCFEKIEKPAVSGAQRKGCLWAMNPAKITKMDDEMQKWSRKDPTAIRNAMIYPNHLEALERGELKYTCRSRSHSEDDTDDTEDDAVDYNVENETDVTEDEVDAGSDGEELEEYDLEETGVGLEDLDVEVTDSLYVTEDQPQTIKIEMEVVDNEILESSYTPNRKRSREVLELDETFTNNRLYHLQLPTRRKTTTYLIKHE